MTDNTVIYGGDVKIYKKGIFGAKWKKCWMQYNTDGILSFHPKKGYLKILRRIHIPTVVNGIMYGDGCRHLMDAAPLPSSMKMLMAIPHNNEINSAFTLILCESDRSLLHWNTIFNQMVASPPSHFQTEDTLSYPPAEPQPLGLPYPTSALQSCSMPYPNAVSQPPSMPYSSFAPQPQSMAYPGFVGAGMKMLRVLECIFQIFLILEPSKYRYKVKQQYPSNQFIPPQHGANYYQQAGAYQQPPQRKKNAGLGGLFSGLTGGRHFGKMTALSAGTGLLGTMLGYKMMRGGIGGIFGSCDSFGSCGSWSS